MTFQILLILTIETETESKSFSSKKGSWKLKTLISMARRLLIFWELLWISSSNIWKT